MELGGYFFSKNNIFLIPIKSVYRILSGRYIKRQNNTEPLFFKWLIIFKMSFKNTVSHVKLFQQIWRMSRNSLIHSARFWSKFVPTVFFLARLLTIVWFGLFIFAVQRFFYVWRLCMLHFLTIWMTDPTFLAIFWFYKILIELINLRDFWSFIWFQDQIFFSNFGNFWKLSSSLIPILSTRLLLLCPLYLPAVHNFYLASND